ncbi:MAG: hypothetical protein LBP90_05145 [Burkholderiales bacterium]|jgi:uncharacterized membrane protein (DUF485 family)|nr:hypothetical protein [Burkholderiales bacterium]
MRTIVLVISLIGTLFFGGVAALSWLNPLYIERAARELVRIEVERRVGEKIDTLSNTKIIGLARRTLEKTNVDLERAEQALRDEVPRRVADAIADLLDADCECRQRLRTYMQQAQTEHISSLAEAKSKLLGWIESAYANVTQSLLRELRIVCFSNAFAFALLGIVTLVRRRATLQLALPALVLVGAVFITTSLYLFNQNWLHTIVFGAYVGWAYSFYLGTVALLLADIAFNRARVCTEIVNMILDAVGSARLLPC